MEGQSGTPGIHYLKTWPEFFEASKAGVKPFELRLNDRDFRVGDILILQEWFIQPGTGIKPGPKPGHEMTASEVVALNQSVKGKYTGRQLVRTITYIFPGGWFGLHQDYVILGVK